MNTLIFLFLNLYFFFRDCETREYAKITVLDSAEVLAEFIQAAKNEGYHVPLNIRWQEMHNIRRASYEEARQRVEHYYRKLSL